MKHVYSSLQISTLLLLIIFLPGSNAYAQHPTQSIMDVGSITSWVADNGFHDWQIDDNYNGSYPKGFPVGVLFSEGICWGGKVFDGDSQLVRVNGSTYASGCSPISRLFRVRSDYFKADLTDDAANFFLKDARDITAVDLAILKDQYEKDWDEWPADRGAPFYDVDNNGKYNPDVDIPGVPGALQTIWINYSDDLSLQLYGSDPIGLEVQETLWAYSTQGRIGNIIYKKVDIIYRGTPTAPPDSRIDSMYICQWSDTQLGNSTDNLIGSDTTLNLGYTYNSSDYDREYSKYNLVPPAVGNTFMQGVSRYTGNSSDSAIFNFKWVKGRKYFNPKPLTSAILHRTAGCFSDPYFAYTGTLEFYNLMAGYLPDPPYPSRRTGCDFNGYGTYMLSGDPVTGTGDIDGVRDGPGSRRYWLMNGPFNMNLGDTAELVEALVVGMGEDHLGSITALRQNTAGAIEYYNYIVGQITNGTIGISSSGRPISDLSPANYLMRQNYPNPFNSFTTIKYELPEPAHVKLTIYDVLGREVQQLVNEEKPGGKYSVQFDAGKLSSGVYLYRITFDNASSKKVFDTLTKTMKFILIK